MKPFTVVPVGYVRQGKDKTILEILPPFTPALQELHNFSHAQILWWIHELDQEEYRKVTTIQPPYQAPLTGVFASRSPVRPNPVGLSTVNILCVDIGRGIIEIKEIDAIPDTPIIDIKGYFPTCDRVRNVQVPQWAAVWGEWLPE